MISKTGYTKHCKHLVKILRKNRKPVKRGGAFLSSLLKSNDAKKDDTTKNNTSDNIKKIENLKTIENLDATYKKLETSQNVAAAVVGAEILVNGAAPLLAASGIGIPLLAILVVAKQIAVQYKQNLELNILLSDVTTIITNCFYLEALIKKTIEKFSRYVSTALQPELVKTSDTTLINEVKEIEKDGGIKNEDDGLNVTPQTGGAEKKAGIDNKIQDKILEKLDILNKLLQEITPSEDDKKSNFNFLRKKAERFFFSKHHKTNIINTLSVINGLFTIYNSQFDWTIRYYENLIFKYYSKNPLDGKGGDEILEEIWNGIETSKEFQDYLFQNEDTIDIALKNPNVENKVEEEIKVVAENPAIETGDDTEESPSTNGGPYSTATATTVEPTKSSTTNGGPYSTTTNIENKIGGSRRIKYNKTTSLSKNKAKHSLKKTKNRKRQHNKYTMKKYK